MSKWVVECDGGCPKPGGPGAYAFVIKENGISKLSRSGFLPSATNNIAEYRAITAAAWYILNKIDPNELPQLVEFWGDSQLIIYQLTGKYRVLDPEIRKYYDEAFAAITELRKRTQVTINWFRRENNSEADELCNQVFDRHGVVLKGKTRLKVAALSK